MKGFTEIPLSCGVSNLDIKVNFIGFQVTFNDLILIHLLEN